MARAKDPSPGLGEVGRSGDLAESGGNQMASCWGGGWALLTWHPCDCAHRVRAPTLMSDPQVDTELRSNRPQAPGSSGSGRRALWVSAISFCVALVALELVARFGLGSLLKPGLGENQRKLDHFQSFVWNRGHHWYAPRAFVGYGLKLDAKGVNSRGFRDLEVATQRKPGVPRIACLGGSTTEGEDEGRTGAFPHLLQEILSQRLGGPVEVMNFGISGWTSAESMVNYFLNVQDFEPDVVIVHHAVNDVRPRLWPNYRTDYAHFRRPWTEPSYGAVGRFLIRSSVLVAALELKRHADFTLNALVGVPLEDTARQMEQSQLLPETTRAFRRNIESIAAHVEAVGGKALLATMPASPFDKHYPGVVGERIRPGLREHNEILRNLAQAEGWALVDLERKFQAREAELSKHFKDHVHVTRAGNRVKAEMISDRLAQGLLPAD